MEQSICPCASFYLSGNLLAKAQEAEANKKKAAGGSDSAGNDGTTIEVPFGIAIEVTVNQLHRSFHYWCIGCF